MRKILFGMICVALVSGCATVENALPLSSKTPESPVDRVSVGMTRPVVVAIMDGRVNIGYEKDPLTGDFRPIRVQRLYSSEILTLGKETYQVDYYLLKTPQGHAVPQDQDLYPLAYKDEILAGKGYDGLEAIKAKYSKK